MDVNPMLQQLYGGQRFNVPSFGDYGAPYTQSANPNLQKPLPDSEPTANINPLAAYHYYRSLGMDHQQAMGYLAATAYHPMPHPNPILKGLHDVSKVLFGV